MRHLVSGKLCALPSTIAGQAERLDVFARLEHLPFPGGKLLCRPMLVAGMLFFRLRDVLWQVCGLLHGRGQLWHAHSPNYAKEITMTHEQFASCIEACNACALACDHCAIACLNEEDPKAMASCIRLDLDCAATCRLAVGAMARDSEHAGAICALCADICESCAQECRQHDMDHCQACADACEQCAQACLTMSQPQGSSSRHRTGAPAHWKG
jgi:hypothetical protein